MRPPSLTSRKESAFSFQLGRRCRSEHVHGVLLSARLKFCSEHEKVGLVADMGPSARSVSVDTDEREAAEEPIGDRP